MGVAFVCFIPAKIRQSMKCYSHLFSAATIHNYKHERHNSRAVTFQVHSTIIQEKCTTDETRDQFIPSRQRRQKNKLEAE